jgi:hypothetical protein
LLANAHICRIVISNTADLDKRAVHHDEGWGFADNLSVLFLETSANAFYHARDMSTK